MGIRISIRADRYFDTPAVLDVPGDDVLGAVMSMVRGIENWHRFDGSEPPAWVNDEDRIRQAVEAALDEVRNRQVHESVRFLGVFSMMLEGTFSDPLPYQTGRRVMTPEERERHERIIARIVRTKPVDPNVAAMRRRRQRRAEAFGDAFELAWQAAMPDERRKLIDRIPRRFADTIRCWSVDTAIMMDTPPFEAWTLWWDMQRHKKAGVDERV